MKNKNIASILTTTILVLAFIPVFGQKAEKKLETVCFDVSLTCSGCENTVMTNIAYEKGVKDIKADHVSKIVTITYRADKTDPEKLAAAIRELGYSARILDECPS